MTRPRQVTQYVADLQSGDAVSDIVRTYHRLMAAWGLDTTIAAAGWGDDLLGQARPYQHCVADSDDHLHLYHFSVACSPLSAHFRRRRGRHMLVYHNITPPYWFEGYDEAALWSTGLARSELASLRDCVDVAVSYSAYNVQELRELGFKRVDTVPFVMESSRLQRSPHAETAAALAKTEVNLLFVGRLAPNKCHEDLIRAFYYYQRIQPRSVLHLVGPVTVAPYADRLRELISSLNLQGKVQLVGRVTDAVLAAYYRTAAVFVCMSEHEGFCVPLLEAMHYEVPVLAYAAAAVPDTLGNAGILLREKRLDMVAEMIDLLVTDAPLRQRVVARQKEHLVAFDETNAGARLRSVIESVA